METCQICGCARHSFFRYAKGAVCHWLFSLFPPIFAVDWLSWLLPSAGDYMYDMRSYCDEQHKQNGGDE